ncbi:MAG TPA: transglutaminase-like cysteine peptidase [Rhizobacter sp.]|nr:transglutaminase-like cysteine peptidase [Rhizobacter sp.]
MLRRTTLAAFAALGLWAQWPARAHTAAPAVRSAAWREYAALAGAAGRLPLDERVDFVNSAINQRIDYAPDTLVCGAADCWQTPTETLALKHGDCEDFAIAKYFVLRDCGLPCGCARLLYALRTPDDTPGLRMPHVVLLGGGTASDPLVFDNLNPLLQPLSKRPDLQPVLSFDVSGLWRGASGERVGDAAALLRPWRELLARWQQQR